MSERIDNSIFRFTFSPRTAWYYTYKNLGFINCKIFFGTQIMIVKSVYDTWKRNKIILGRCVVSWNPKQIQGIITIHLDQLTRYCRYCKQYTLIHQVCNTITHEYLHKTIGLVHGTHSEETVLRLEKTT